MVIIEEDIKPNYVQPKVNNDSWFLERVRKRA